MTSDNSYFDPDDDDEFESGLGVPEVGGFGPDDEVGYGESDGFENDGQENFSGNLYDDEDDYSSVPGDNSDALKPWLGGAIIAAAGFGIIYFGYLIWCSMYPPFTANILGEQTASLQVGDPVVFHGQQIGKATNISQQDNVPFATLTIDSKQAASLPTNIEFKVENSGILQGKQITITIDPDQPSIGTLQSGATIPQSKARTLQDQLFKVAEGAISLQLILVAAVMIFIGFWFLKVFLQNMIGIIIFVAICAGVLFVIFKTLG